MTPKIVKQCTECGEKFNSSSGSRLKCPACCKCLHCGKPIRYSFRKFCSHRCYSTWRAAHPESYIEQLSLGQKRGPRKAVYSQSVTEREAQMHRTEYKEWRLAVLLRDDFACVLCSSRKKIQAHHIRPWRSHPELRHAQSNGVALCFECHMSMNWREKEFGEIFLSYVKTMKAVKLTEDQRKSLQPILCNCETCGAPLRKPRWKCRQKYFFCNKKCTDIFRAKGGFKHCDWRTTRTPS